MLQSDCTAKLLDMKHMIFKNVEHSATTITLSVEMERRVSECPACQTPTDIVHDYRTQRVKDSPIQGKAVIWLYRKRRYRCLCCGKRFYESNYLLPKWHHTTNRLALLTLNRLKVKMSRKELAEIMGVSPSTVARWLALAEFGKPTKLPNVLSIDEFKGNTEYGKFQCILTDPKKHRVLDILPSFREVRFASIYPPFPTAAASNTSSPI